eukprot:491468_1
MVGTLRSAKKRKIIKFKGQMLLKGMHDNVPIQLLVGNDDDDGGSDAIADEQPPADIEPVAAADTEPAPVEPDAQPNNENTDDAETVEDANNTAIEEDNQEENEMDNDANEAVEPKAETQVSIVVNVEATTTDAAESKENMVEIHGKCIAQGCKCDKYVENPSKWSKGKCKTCDHPPIRHKKTWVKASSLLEDNNKGSASPYSPYSPVPAIAKAEAKKTEEVLENTWGEEFTGALGECVNTTFNYDEESILAAKYLLHYLKKHKQFDFTGQSQHRDALKFVFVEQFGWKAINAWGYN